MDEEEFNHGDENNGEEDEAIRYDDSLVDANMVIMRMENLLDF